jgi:hypothetical protein
LRPVAARCSTSTSRPIVNISDYLKEMEYAASGVIELMWHEHIEAEALRKEIEKLQRVAEENYERAYFIQQNAEDADDLMLGVGMHWDTYFGEDKDHHYKSTDLATLESSLALKEFSFSSLAGTLLQYAKQGLSASFGAPENWPQGRLIGTLSLKTIILEARNQSEHWEDGNPKSRVQRCFDTLATDKTPDFAEYRTKNLAFEVVSLLEWRSYAEFKADLLSMKTDEA